MSDQLLPCPFCGGEASMVEASTERDAEISCDNPGCLTACYVTADALVPKEADRLAISAWNTRSRDAEVAELRSHLDLLEVDFAPRSSLKEAYAEITSLQAEVAELVEALLTLGDLTSEYRDAGPDGESWSSNELTKARAKALVILAKHGKGAK